MPYAPRTTLSHLPMAQYFFPCLKKFEQDLFCSLTVMTFASQEHPRYFMNFLNLAKATKHIWLGQRKPPQIVMLLTYTDFIKLYL